MGKGRPREKIVVFHKSSRFPEFSPARSEILAFFDALQKRVFKRADIGKIFSEGRSPWRLSDTTTATSFLKFLLEEGRLEQLRLEFPSRNEIRYAWGPASVMEIALSLKPGSYLSHFTATYLHNLTEQIPKTIYLNQEQPYKPHQANALDQESIKRAFGNAVRVSHNTAEFREYRICILNGMYTGQLGVIDVPSSDGENLRVTNVERTLIDIAVRPVYAGGVFEVLRAFKAAKGNASVNRIVAFLRKLSYVYPYHQAIGFYLERAGYADSSIRLLNKFEIKNDFYLVHGMKEVVYSNRWRLFFPEGL